MPFKHSLSTTIKLILLFLFVSTMTLHAKPKHVDNEVLVQIKNEIDTMNKSAVYKRDEIDKIAKKFGGKANVVSRRKAKKPASNAKSSKSSTSKEKVIMKLTKIKNDDINAVIEELKKLDEVEFAEPNYIFNMDDFNTSESNPLSGDQWYLDQNQIRDAWDLFGETDLSKLGNVVVAVLDSGIDYNHEDLQDAMWRNLGEIPGNNIDDDANGYIDDVYGANVLYKTEGSTASAAYTDPIDNHGHGTHVAGIIGAVNNDTGTIGIASGVQIMAIKCARADGSLTSEGIIMALDYARNKNAHVVNMSFGGGADSIILKNALADLSATTVLVASAGNLHKPVEWDELNSCGMFGIPPAPSFPAAYPFVLGVEARDSGGTLAAFSNCDPLPQSPLEYEVRMPGVSIMSTLPGNAYASWNGTSMAAPMASALAALIKVKQWDNADVFTNRMVQGQVAQYASDFVAALTQNPTPNLKYFNHGIFDVTGDNDEIADAGETVTLAMKIKNYWGAAKDVKLKVSPGFIIDGTSTFSEDPFVSIVNPNGDNNSQTVEIPLIGSYTIGSNGIETDEFGNITDVTLPIELLVDPEAPNLHRAVFTVELEYKNALDETDTTIYTTDPKQFSFDLQNGIEVIGVITSDTTWVQNSRYIVTGPLLIEDGVVLTIEDGVEVRFVNDAFLKVNGTLIANGTKENKILFTFNENDFGDGLGWSGLRFHDTYDESNQISMLNFAIIEKSDGAIVSGTDYNLSNSIIRNTNQYLQGNSPDGRVTINNCIFEFSFSGITNNFRSMEILYPSITNTLFTGIHKGKVSSSDLVFPFGIYLNGANLLNSVINVPDEYNFIDRYTSTRLAIYMFEDNSEMDDLTTQLYVAGNRGMFNTFLLDYSDNFDPNHVRLSDSGDNDEMLSRTMPTPPSTTPAFLVNAQWFDGSMVEKTILEVGSTYTLRLTFNKEKMDTTKQPLVTFGSLYPYTDKTVEGDWLDPDGNSLAQVWEAEYTMTSHSGSGMNTLRVNGALDTDMMYDAPLSEIYQFSIIATGAQALVLQANGYNGYADISWMQDDYEFVGGYNLYRGQIADDADNYTKINAYPILDLNYRDTDVLPGETYYYVFRAILSDGTLSPASNIASATIVDNVAPIINHAPITKVHPGNYAYISAIVTDNIAVNTVKIYYRVKNSGAYISADMIETSTENQYSYTIASSYFNEGMNVEYYIEATDNTENITTLPVQEIAVTDGDVAPVIEQVANISVPENSNSFSVALNISDADNESFGVTVSSSDPSILSVTSSSSSSVSLAPQSNQYGTITITVIAENALLTTMSFDVTVTHSDGLPTIAPIANIAKIKEFADFSVPIIASDPDGDAISLSIENSNPDIIQASLQDSDILISSIPYAVGQSTITVTATANGKSVTRSFLVEVLLSDNGTDTVYNYQLNTGWNLVGFLPYASSVASLPDTLKDSDNVTVIWQYDTDSNTWLGYSPDPTIAPGLAGREITEIQATDGIWILCKKPIVVTLINPPEPTITSGDIVLKNGWNLISSPDGSSIDPASFTDAALVWSYDTGTWKVYSNDLDTLAEAADANMEIIQSLSGTEGFWVLK